MVLYMKQEKSLIYTLNAWKKQIKKTNEFVWRYYSKSLYSIFSYNIMLIHRKMYFTQSGLLRYMKISF